MMKRTTSQTIAYLFMLLSAALLVTGGCTAKKTRLLKKKQQDVIKAYREYLTESINDPERAEKLIALGEDLYLLLKQDTETLLELLNDLSSLNKGYETTRQELEAGFKALTDHRRVMREKILVARVKAEAQTTPEEWEALMKRNRTLMDLIQETPGLL
jgi:hypothetical protein